jgi:hypothetical protein
MSHVLSADSVNLQAGEKCETGGAAGLDGSAWVPVRGHAQRAYVLTALGKLFAHAERQLATAGPAALDPSDTSRILTTKTSLWDELSLALAPVHRVLYEETNPSTDLSAPISAPSTSAYSTTRAMAPAPLEPMTKGVAIFASLTLCFVEAARARREEPALEPTARPEETELSGPRSAIVALREVGGVSEAGEAKRKVKSVSGSLLGAEKSRNLSTAPLTEDTKTKNKNVSRSRQTPNSRADASPGHVQRPVAGHAHSGLGKEHVTNQLSVSIHRTGCTNTGARSTSVTATPSADERAFTMLASTLFQRGVCVAATGSGEPTLARSLAWGDALLSWAESFGLPTLLSHDSSSSAGPIGTASARMGEPSATRVEEGEVKEANSTCSYCLRVRAFVEGPLTAMLATLAATPLPAPTRSHPSTADSFHATGAESTSTNSTSPQSHDCIIASDRGLMALLGLALAPCPDPASSHLGASSSFSSRWGPREGVSKVFAWWLRAGGWAARASPRSLFISCVWVSSHPGVIYLFYKTTLHASPPLCYRLYI